MAKCAIYFDARERDLARRVLWMVSRQLVTTGGLSLDRFAYDWTRDEVLRLKEKFNEPPTTEQKGGVQE